MGGERGQYIIFVYPFIVFEAGYHVVDEFLCHAICQSTSIVGFLDS